MEGPCRQGKPQEGARAHPNAHQGQPMQGEVRYPFYPDYQEVRGALDSGPRSSLCLQFGHSLHALKYLLLALGIVHPQERESSGNPSLRAHRRSALLHSPSLIPHFPQQTSGIHAFRRLVPLLSPAANTSRVQLQPKLALPRSGRWEVQLVLP